MKIPAPAPKPDTPSAFTLIELLAVIAILAALLLLALSRAKEKGSAALAIQTST